jgi:hypothetical protein
MKGLPMKTLISKKTILLSIALFVQGVAAGSLIVYRYQRHKQSASMAENPREPATVSTEGIWTV